MIIASHFLKIKTKLRAEKVNQKAKELAQLAQEIKQARDIRETEEQSAPVNTVYQEEINQRLRELAELAKCGTLDIAIKLAVDTM